MADFRGIIFRHNLGSFIPSLNIPQLSSSPRENEKQKKDKKNTRVYKFFLQEEQTQKIEDTKPTKKIQFQSLFPLNNNKDREKKKKKRKKRDTIYNQIAAPFFIADTTSPEIELAAAVEAAEIGQAAQQAVPFAFAFAFVAAV